jgi:hypothetical protein
MMETVINFVIFILGEVSFYAYAQRLRLCAGVGIEFRLLVNVSQSYRFKLMIYSFAK